MNLEPVCLWLAIIVLSVAASAKAQTLDTFQPAPNGTVYAMAVQPDGKIIAGGSFTTLGGQPRTFIGRVNTDGTLDPTFNPQIDGYYVTCVAVQPDGKILVGGWFWSLCGVPRGGLGRLNVDGSLDATFVDPAANWPVINSLVLQADGKIVIGGNFSSLGGQPHYYLARLNSDGTQDSVFTAQPDNEVMCLALQPDGKIVVGGLFNYLAGQLTLRIGRLNSDGTFDAQFQPSTDQNVYWLACLGLQADGKILVGGDLSSLGGAARSNMGRLNTNGTLDTSFSAASSGWVYSLVPQADGKILVGSTGSASVRHLWRLTAAGAMDGSFSADADNEVFSITLQPDGNILVSGDFANLAGAPCNFLGRVVNTDPATQSLTTGDSGITWLRGGTSPEAWRTTFEASTNGTDWASLGEGTRIPGGWQLSGVSAPATSTVRARGFVAGGYQNGLSWMAEASIGPLLISAEPQSRTNDAASPAAFRVSAAGNPTLTYQWRKNGTNLDDGANVAGAHEPTLILDAVLAADRGGYSVVVGNGSMALTSQVATLTVIDPVITSQPTSLFTNAGQAVSFSVSAAGTPTVGYQWFKNGVTVNDGGTILGSQTQMLTLTNVSGGDRGDYWVVITNSSGSVTSMVASLSVADPFIATQPVSQVIAPGGTVSFNVVAVGTPSLSYQWRKYGAEIPGATVSTLTLTNAQWPETGSYDVVVTNAFGSVTSSAASLAFASTPDAFNPGAGNSVYCLAVQPDGKILVGGSFTTLGGQARTNIGRLNSDGTLDPSFNPGAPGLAVYCVAVQPDGKIVTGGGFNSLGGQSRTNLGRLNPDGTLDLAFTPSINGFVRSLALQPDGRIIIGGSFSTLGGQARMNIGRLYADGTLDTSFNPGANGQVNAFVVEADSTILVGGEFSALATQARSNLGRLKSDGTLDDNFNPAPDGGIYSLTVQGDGHIVAGGSFTVLAGQPSTYLGRMTSDGTLDPTFNPGPNGVAFAVAAQANGQILVAGAMTSLGGAPRNYIGRINPDGSLDPTFNPGADASVYAVAVQPDGKLLVGGDFSSIGGQARNHIARLTSTELALQSLTFDGSRILWSRGGASPELSRASFDVSTNGVGWLSLGNASYESGTWQVIGLSMPLNSVVRARGYIAAGYHAGSSWFLESSIGPPAISIPPSSRTNLALTLASFTALGAGTSPIAYQWLKNGVTLTDAGNLSGANTSTLMLSNVLGADMGGYSVVISNGFGAITSSVAVLTVVDPLITGQPLSVLSTIGLNAGFNVTAIGTPPFDYQWRKNGIPLFGATSSSLTLTNVQWADGGDYDVLVSNAYSTNASTPATLALPVTVDSFNPSPGGPVYSLAVQTDGKILVGGSFSTLAGFLRLNAGRLLSNGTLDLAFNPAPNGTVFSMAVQTDGAVFLGGGFTTLGGQVRSFIGRVNFDGSLDSAFNAGADGTVNALAVQADGKILTGGAFTRLGGQPHISIGRLNSNGTPDLAFNPSTGGTVNTLAVQSDGKIIVGGSFNNISGQTVANIGRLNPDGTLDNTFNPPANSAVYCVVVQPSGKIVVAGTFTVLCGQARAYIGRLNPDGSLDTTFNPAANDRVISVALQSDGKILIGGNFSILNSQTRRYIARLNPDGTLDSTFNQGANSVVSAVALQPDGSILAGGVFSTIANQSRSRLARLTNTYPATQDLGYDGSSITWLRNGAAPELWTASFEFSTNGTSWVSAGTGQRIGAAWQVPADSVPVGATIYARGFVAAAYESASGWFLEAGAGPPAIRTQPQSRTNNAGTTASFGVTAAGSSTFDYHWFRNGIGLTDGGNIVGARSATLTLTNVLGADAAQFWVVITNAYGSITSSVANLTVVDPSILRQAASRTNNAGTTATFSVQASGTPALNYQWFKADALLQDGQRISGTQTASLTLSNVLGADMGGYWMTVSNSFGTVTGAIASLTVIDPFITSQPVGQTVAPGQTVAFNVAAVGTTPAYQWRKNASPIAGATSAGLLLTNVQRADGGLYDVIVSNSFSVVTSVPAILTVNLATADSFNPGANNTVYTVAVQPDGKILAGGPFTSLAGQTRNSLGRLNTDGTIDVLFSPDAVGNDGVYCFATQDTGILVGGAFLSLAGQAQQFYGRLYYDGTLDPAFSVGAHGWVSCLLPQSDGKILISGGFNAVGGQSRGFIARLNAGGILDPGFDPQANYTVLQMALQPDGKILACGGFTSIGGQTNAYIARLNPDGSSDPSFSPGANAPVFSLALQPDGRIVVAGSFTNISGQARSYIARLNSDGTLDNGFTPGANNSVYTLAIQSDGKILAGGPFTILGGQPRNRLGRLNPDGSLDSTFGPAADGAVNTIALQPDGAILVAGSFATLAGQPRASLGRLNNTDPAGQILTFDGTNLTWLRAGSSPEIWRASFDTSADGTNWTNLGQGTRIPGGWQLANVAFPAASTVRARGFVPGAGYYNASSWFLQTQLQLRPEILSASFSSNQFGAIIRGVPGQPVIIQASTDLVQWAAIQTNIVSSSGTVPFRDTDSNQFSRRFYRARY